MENHILPSCPDQVSKKVSAPVRPSDYTNPDIPTRRWKISYGKNQVFYLTDTERSFFLNSIWKGEKYVQIGQLTLSNLFFYMMPIKKIPVDSQGDIIPLQSTEERERSLAALDKMRKNLVNILNKKNGQSPAKS